MAVSVHPLTKVSVCDEPLKVTEETEVPELKSPVQVNVEVPDIAKATPDRFIVPELVKFVIVPLKVIVVDGPLKVPELMRL